MTEKVYSMWLECFSMIKDMFQGKKGKYDDISFFLSIFAVGMHTEKWQLQTFVGNYSIYAIY